MSFGELMVGVGAFNQVQSALRWFVDNFSGIADWRATLLRVAIFRQEILTMDELGRNASPIKFEESDGPVRIDYLRVSSRPGCIKSSEPYTELQAGQRGADCSWKRRGKSPGFAPPAASARGATDRSRARFVHPLCSCWFAPTPRLAPYATRSLPAPVFQIRFSGHRQGARRCWAEHLHRELDVEERWDGD
jgi:putative ATP-binding cassette transporter